MKMEINYFAINMKYLIIDKLKAVDIGLHADHYQQSNDGNRAIINENDLMNAYVPGPTLQDKAAILGIDILTLSELKQKLNQGGW